MPPLLQAIASAVGVSLDYIQAMDCSYASRSASGGGNVSASGRRPAPVWQPGGQRQSQGQSGPGSELPKDSEEGGHMRQLHGRFWAAMILREVVLEVPLAEICARFQVQRGQIQGLQAMGATFAGMVASFAGKLHWWQLQVLCTSLQNRMDAGAQPDILPLTRVPHVKSFRARALFKAGIRTPEELARAPVAKVEAALRTVTPFRMQGQAPRRSSKADRKIAEQIQEAAARMLLSAEQITPEATPLTTIF